MPTPYSMCNGVLLLSPVCGSRYFDCVCILSFRGRQSPSFNRVGSLPGYLGCTFRRLDGYATSIAFGLEPTVGPGLTFVTMPAVFAHMPFGTFFAVLFYICLIVAAITSSVSIFEAVVAAMRDLHVSRRTAVPVAFISIMIIGVFCTMSFGPLADF